MCAQRIEFSRRKHGLKIRPEFFELIWLPDLLIMNANSDEAHLDPLERKKVPLKFVVIRQKPGMTCGMRYQIKGFAIMSCPMSFTYFPKDVQSCPVQVRSFRFPRADLALRWSQPFISRRTGRRVHPVTTSGNILLPGHFFSFTFDKSLVTVVNDTYDMLIVNILFERSITTHIFATFLPTALLVLITMSTFWYKSGDSTSDRLSLAISCLLTLITYFIDSRSRLPSSGSINSMDVWNVMCVLFVTLQVMQAVLVDFVYERAKQRHVQLVKAAADFDWRKQILAHNDVRRVRRLNLLMGSAKGNRLPVRMLQRVNLYAYSRYAALQQQEQEDRRLTRVFMKNKSLSRKRRGNGWYLKSVYRLVVGSRDGHRVPPSDPRYLADRLDAFSRMLFPAAFLLFNMYYWPSLFHNPATRLLPSHGQQQHLDA